MANSRLTLLLGVGAAAVLALGMAQVTIGGPDPVGGGSDDGALVFEDEGRPVGPLCSFEVTADELNVRAAPDARSPVVGSLDSGDVTTAESTVEGGYRRLGEGRWVVDEFLDEADGSECASG